MPFCIKCGKELPPDCQYCPACGQAVSPAISNPAVQGPALPELRGLSRDRLVYLTREGLSGIRVASDASLALAVVLPLPLLGAFWYLTRMGALAVYLTLWMVASGLLFDWLRWRGLKKAEDAEPRPGLDRWLIPWSSLRMVDWNGRTLWFSRFSHPKKMSVTFDRKDAPAVETGLKWWGVRYSQRAPKAHSRLTSFWSLVVVTFVASQVVMFLAATTPFAPGQQQLYTTIYNSTESHFTNATFYGQFQAIYSNNLQVAWGNMVPGLGAVSLAAASYNTGRVIQVIAILAAASQHQSISPAAVYLTLFLYPHSWVEELSYPMALVGGVLGVTRWRSVSAGEFARFTNWGSVKLAAAWVGVALALLAAGLLEVSEPVLGMTSGAFLLWIPVLVGSLLLYLLNRRRRTSTLAEAGRVHSDGL